jgi:hypothetical protein
LKTLRLFPYLIFPPILFPYRPKLVKEAGKYFDQVVTKILEKEVGGFKALFPACME